MIPGNDDALMWVCPALSIGYAVVNDPQGRLRFYTDDVEIIWRCGKWIAITLPVFCSDDAAMINNFNKFAGIDKPLVNNYREYTSLHAALVSEA